MKPLTAVDENVKENLLAEAAMRNLSADLVVVRGENLQAHLKTRFLRCEPERILFEVPVHNGRPSILQTGQFVEVYFKIGNERFGFDSRVIGYSRAALNPDLQVEAVGIAPPHFLERRQRRKFYRVSVASLPSMAAELLPAQGDPHQTEPIQARLCNLSAGGVAVLVDRQRWQFTTDHEYLLRFTLPGLEPGFEFRAVVCHVRHIFHSRRQIVGLAFLPGADQIGHRRAIERVSRFVAARQCEELFRSRRSGQAPPAGLSVPSDGWQSTE